MDRGVVLNGLPLPFNPQGTKSCLSSNSLLKSPPSSPLSARCSPSPSFTSRGNNDPPLRRRSHLLDHFRTHGGKPRTPALRPPSLRALTNNGTSQSSRFSPATYDFWRHQC